MANVPDFSKLSVEQMLAAMAEMQKAIRLNPALKDKKAQILASQQSAVRDIRAHQAGITNALNVFADHVGLDTLLEASTVVSITSPGFGEPGGSVSLAALKRPRYTIRVMAVFDKADATDTTSDVPEEGDDTTDSPDASDVQ